MNNLLRAGFPLPSIQRVEMMRVIHLREQREGKRDDQ
ncbi:hypothetical protein MTsPCn9_04920 [Croceitalea sp. MTPC9]|nr:hypothetical protein MTsPCn6_03790 [Croceitalea sp. MTPC6]GMN15556.1 hypothetical protein MTsPCn9_04920 [Croceitalea sp. MTPC9]